MIRLDSWLQQTTAKLQAAGIDSDRLDCLVLLEDILNTNRTQLLASPDTQLTDIQLASLASAVQKRIQHLPLAYIRGRCEFYGRTFLVNEQVLIPRPESEAIIDTLKSLELPANPSVADVGSGSGILGITAVLELPGSQITLLEISPDALAVSQQNIKLHNVKVQAIHSDLLSGVNEQFDVLLCNLPYVPTSLGVNKAAEHEPRLALFGGIDGLDLYRKLFGQLTDTPVPPKYVITESLEPQHQDLTQIATQHGYALLATTDLVQLFAKA